MLNAGPVDILVVEDNDSDCASIVEALQRSIPASPVVAVRDGTEALEFLFARGIYAERIGETPPRLILLDLAMPGVDGFSVLEAIRSSDPEAMLTLTPVVVFTDSSDFNDVHKCYCYGANSYIVKPVRFSDFQSVVETISQYWIKHNIRSV